jgi:hypothetical protein
MYSCERGLDMNNEPINTWEALEMPGYMNIVEKEH